MNGRRNRPGRARPARASDSRRPRTPGKRSGTRPTSSRPRDRAGTRSTTSRPRAGTGASRRPSSARRGPLRSGPTGEVRAVGTASRAQVDRLAWDSIVPHLLKAGVDVEHSTTRLRQYTALLLDWNRSVSNLIARSDETRVLARHIAESIEPAHWLKASGCERWLDFGSGGGLPALPLAICGVGREWTLVESRRTKTLFIRKAIQDIGLNGIEVVQQRLEDVVLEAERSRSVEGFTSRATMKLGPTLALAAPLITPGGKAFLWKGGRLDDEMREDKQWQKAWDFDGLLGIGDGQTVVARFTRTEDK